VHSPVSEEEKKQFLKEFRILGFSLSEPQFIFLTISYPLVRLEKYPQRVLMNNRQTVVLQYQYHGFSIVLQYKTARLVHP
jgi:hypothetical protein